MDTRSPAFFWHNLGIRKKGKLWKSLLLNGKVPEMWSVQWWAHLVSVGQISVDFQGKSEDYGARFLKKYVTGDTILMYASGHGAIGWGVVDSPEYERAGENDNFSTYGRQLHRLAGIKWKDCVRDLNNAISAEDLNEKFGINHPLHAREEISDVAKAKDLIQELTRRVR